VNVERVSLRDARQSCLRDKEERGVLRHATTMHLDISLRAFERWLCSQARYAEQSIDEKWTPDVSEVTTDDILAYLSSLRSKKGIVAAPKTKNNARADLRSFFNWCMGMEDDRPLPGVSRRWHSVNPAAAVPKQVEPESVPAVLSVEEAEKLMKHVEAFKGGRLVPYFALALFAGLRPGPDGELRKLHTHPNRDEPCREASGRPLIDLVRGVLTVTADISKTRRKRVVTIQPNLRRWLARYGTDILPQGHGRDIKEVRAGQSLGHDVLRHSFISYHVAAFRSKAGTALEAGNSESIIDAHYLNLPTLKEGKAFFSIRPASGGRKVVPMLAAKEA
jgi:integrase